MLLGVNIDHIAVLREARAINDPDPLEALSILNIAKADQITIHLREDRRHIVDSDLKAIIASAKMPVNVECAISDDVLDVILPLYPHRITLVPENRQEVTTEGGLDLKNNFEKIKKVIEKAHESDISVSLFIDPNEESVKLSKDLNANWIELHTGRYANIFAMKNTNLRKTHHSIKEFELPQNELEKLFFQALGQIQMSADLAESLGLLVAAGHGLNYQNVSFIAKIKSIKELNIGQSIIARSVFVGLEKAILQMKELI